MGVNDVSIEHSQPRPKLNESPRRGYASERPGELKWKLKYPISPHSHPSRYCTFALLQRNIGSLKALS